MSKEIPILKELPDKFYFKVGEVSELADVPAYVLRFWETEFKKIKPKRTPSGQRLYRKEDVELILKIKYLLYKKKFTIQGARQHLKSVAATQQCTHSQKTIDKIRIELKKILDILK
ncbi:MAG: MerR family transcriptional regulator [Desulfosarcina sp.]|nr:MerR family transcriptional regulator [Desulfobacterales bacterium]